MVIPLPQTLPLLINDSRPEARETIAKILKGGLELKDILHLLSRYWKVKIWFSKPVSIEIHRRWITQGITEEDKERNIISRKACIHSKTSDLQVFNKFFMHGDTLCYATSKQGRHGYYFEWFDSIIKYEPVIEEDHVVLNRFDSYEQFKRKFDPLFITEAEIQKLWNGKSCQHGGQYKPSDFHGIGPVGKKVMADFLRHFKGIDKGGDIPGYLRSPHGDYYRLEAEHCTYRHTGRDIRISHQTNVSYVYYSSEFQNCGNGRYGLVANRYTFLWLEDD